MKKPPPSAYELASDRLATESGISLGVESVAKIYQRLKPQFIGDRDLIKSAVCALRNMQRMRDGLWVAQSDEEPSRGDPVRDSDDRPVLKVRIGN